MIAMWFLLTDIRAVSFILGILLENNSFINKILSFFDTPLKSQARQDNLKDNSTSEFIKVITRYGFVINFLWAVFCFFIMGQCIVWLYYGHITQTESWALITYAVMSGVLGLATLVYLSTHLMKPGTNKGWNMRISINGSRAIFALIYFSWQLILALCSELRICEKKHNLVDLDTLKPPADVKIRSAFQIKELMRDMKTFDEAEVDQDKNNQEEIA